MKYLKKISLLLLSLMLAVSFCACAAASPKAETVAEGKTLSEIMETLLSGVELPAVENIEITEENFKSYLFIDPVAGEALASEARINAIAHSVVLLRVDDPSIAADTAAEIEKNANPMKWICVMADSVRVLQRGDLILLVMSLTDTADAIAENFEALS